MTHRPSERPRTDTTREAGRHEFALEQRPFRLLERLDHRHHAGTIALSAWLLFANRKTDKQPDAEAMWPPPTMPPMASRNMTTPCRVGGSSSMSARCSSLSATWPLPRLGNFAGLLGWSQEAQWDSEMQQAEARYAPIFASYAERPIAELANDAEAMQVGERLFLNNCAICHGSNARGGNGFPDLSDDAWLYGGSPQDIVTSITQGRSGAMPAWEHLAKRRSSTSPSTCCRCRARPPTGAGGKGTRGLHRHVRQLPPAGRDRQSDDGRTEPDRRRLALPGSRPVARSRSARDLRNGRNGQMPAQVDYLARTRFTWWPPTSTS